jgi:tetratricopeptide (TPR) repeat protein
VPRHAALHVDDPRAVGQRIRAAREEAGLSQRQLAFTGCTAAYISRIEAGARVPSLQLIHEFARRLRVSPEFLATGVENFNVDENVLVDAEVALRLGDVEEAERVFRAHLTPHDPARPAALAGLGQIAYREGNDGEAVDYLEEAIESRGRLLADPTAVDTLGRAYAATGALEDAVALFERARAEAQAAEAPVERLRFDVLLANALIDSGRFDRAEEILSESIRLTVELHDPLAEARVYWSQSRLHVVRNDPYLAARYARKALDILQRTENDSYVAQAYHLLAYAEVAAGNPREAWRLLERGRELFGGRFTEREDAKFALEEARTLLALGRLPAAAKAAGRALDIIDALDPQDRGRSYFVLGDVFRANGETARARDLYERSIALLEDSGRPYLLDAATRLSDLLEAEGDPEAAYRTLKQALGTSRANAPAAP